MSKYELAKELENTLEEYGYNTNVTINVSETYDYDSVKVYGEKNDK